MEEHENNLNFIKTTKKYIKPENMVLNTDIKYH